MVTKAVILIILGLASPGQNPKAVQAGTYPSPEECSVAYTALRAAATKPIYGVCITTVFPYTGRDA